MRKSTSLPFPSSFPLSPSFSVFLAESDAPAASGSTGSPAVAGGIAGASTVSVSAFDCAFAVDFESVSSTASVFSLSFSFTSLLLLLPLSLSLSLSLPLSLPLSFPLLSFSFLFRRRRSRSRECDDWEELESESDPELDPELEPELEPVDESDEGDRDRALARDRRGIFRALSYFASTSE